MPETTDAEHVDPADPAPGSAAAPAEVTAAPGAPVSRIFTDRGLGILLAVGSAIALLASFQLSLDKIGRASCRERV